MIAALGPQRAVIGGSLAAVGVAGEKDTAEAVSVGDGAGPGARELDGGAGRQGGGGKRLILDQFGDGACVAVDAGFGQDRGGAGIILRDAQARAAEAVQVRGDEVDVGFAADAAHLGEDRGARGAAVDEISVAGGGELGGVAGEDFGDQAAEAVVGRASRGSWRRLGP